MLIEQEEVIKSKLTTMYTAVIDGQRVSYSELNETFDKAIAKQKCMTMAAMSEEEWAEGFKRPRS